MSGMYEHLENVLEVARQIQDDVNETIKPPREGRFPRTAQVVEFALVAGTRGYIEKITIQINGAYENGWFDATAVMLRKLMETLLIEAYEGRGIEPRIKNSNGDYMELEKIINRAKADLNLSRDLERIMKDLKQLGDRSAHSRRFYARRVYIENRFLDIQTMVQELVAVAGLN